ncbi:hypothetical protein [Hahella ganghwensis]|uniref:hypothetical protein n=1 Tax=Hahella ganghwensis TaxID=286420 RepID=UPI00037E5ABB|nr:hypothetical protein [Hahella ganghwensis]
MCDHEANTNILKLHDWMYTLLYPAVLGTLIVSFIYGWTGKRVDAPYNLLFALFVIFYFSSQHVENVLDKNNYTYWEFASDFVEVLIMAPMLYVLGFYDEIPALEGFQFSWYAFYTLLTVALLLPIIARLASSKLKLSWDAKEAWLTLLSLLATIVAIAGFYWNTSVWVLSVLYSIFTVYLLGFVFGLAEGRIYNRGK